MIYKDLKEKLNDVLDENLYKHIVDKMLCEETKEKLLDKHLVSKIKHDYKHYEQYIYHNKGQSNYDIEEERLLRKCYSSERKDIKNFKEKLITGIHKRVTKVQCPFCGNKVEMDSSSPLDHYLPKSKYPQFSVYPQNLILICTKCNNKKRDEVFNNDSRKYIHAYLDSHIYEMRYLYIEISLIKGSIIPIYKLNPTVFKQNKKMKEFKIIENHYDGLDLIERYSHRASDEIIDIIIGFKDLYLELKQLKLEEKEILNCFKKTLKQKLKRDLELYNHNYYMCVIYEELFNQLCLNPKFISDNAKFFQNL